MGNSLLGSQGEDKAVRYLFQQGYKIIARNFRVRTGEIDIIADDAGRIVFVEVKTRTSQKFGTAGQAVNYRKQQKIIRTAQLFLRQSLLYERLCRFDVIEVYKKGDNWEINHIKSAFEF